jgi:hypothetical protein
MTVARDAAAAAGAVLVLAAGWSVLGTLVVPRRVRSWFTRYLAVAVRQLFHVAADRFATYNQRDRLLAAQAPVQLILQIAVWLAAFEVGFALLLWPFEAGAGLGGAFEQIGSSMFTLGYAAPHSGTAAALDDLAAVFGLGTLALQIGYLPILYTAFNRRETLVAMLDSRASVPSWGPELLARTHYGLGTGVSAVSTLPELFAQWEAWSADVSESHATYPPLVYFRSPHPLSSWVTAQLAVLDAASLYLSLLPDAPGAVSARLCLRGGFTCLNTIARALNVPIPYEADPDEGISLRYEEFAQAVERLRRVGFPTERPTSEAWLDFLGWRVNYEKAAYALAEIVDAPPALWSGPRRRPIEPVAPFRPPTRRARRPPVPAPE